MFFSGGPNCKQNIFENLIFARAFTAIKSNIDNIETAEEQGKKLKQSYTDKLKTNDSNKENMYERIARI